MKFLVVIASYNSESSILDVIAQIQAHAPELDLLVVDRGSNDRTKELLQNNSIRRLEMCLHATYYDAVALGLTYAYDNVYDAVVEFDDTGLFRVEDILYLMQIMEHKNTDFVLGSRYIGHQKIRSRSKFLSFASRLTTGYVITDPAMRFRIYGEKAIEFFGTSTSMNLPTPDRIIQLIRNNYSFCEAYVELNSKIKRQNKKRPLLALWENLGWIFSILLINPFRTNKNKKEKYE